MVITNVELREIELGSFIRFWEPQNPIHVCTHTHTHAHTCTCTYTLTYSPDLYLVLLFVFQTRDFSVGLEWFSDS